MNWTEFLNETLDGIPKPKLPDDVQIPVLPNVISDFSRKSDDPDVNAKQLAAIIEVDSGLTCELLKHVNSSAIGLKRKAVSPQQAISMLGVRQSKLFLLTRGLRASLRGLESNNSDLIDFNTFWNSNLERALFARETAKVLKADVDVAFAAAMMQDMMIPILAKSNSEVYEQFIANQETEPILLTLHEQDKLGFDHAIAATFLMRGWSFPDDLVSCILCHHHGIEVLDQPDLKKMAIAAVAVSALLPDQLQQVPGGLNQLPMVEEKIAGFRLERLAQDVDTQIGEMAASLENRKPLAERCAEVLAASEPV